MSVEKNRKRTGLEKELDNGTRCTQCMCFDRPEAQREPEINERQEKHEKVKSERKEWKGKKTGFVLLAAMQMKAALQQC